MKGTIYMGCLGNIIWMIAGGIISAISWLAVGCLWCLTIVGIPIGLQCFKMAGLSFMPFGKDVVRDQDGLGNFLLNILWILFGGLELAFMHLFFAAILAITIIGIPFAKQQFKLAILSFTPFGARVVLSDTVYMDIR
jgi:uncharacterized membrane protein YccF (DUF307 family)